MVDLASGRSGPGGAHGCNAAGGSQLPAPAAWRRTSSYFQKHVKSHETQKIKKGNAKRPILNAEPEDGSQVEELEPLEPLESQVDDAAHVDNGFDHCFDDGDEPFLLDALRDVEKDLESSRPFFMEREDQEEEARRCEEPKEPAVPAKKSRKGKKALGKCPTCKANYFSLDGYFKHNQTHIFSELLCKVPDLLSVLHASHALMMESVKQCMDSQVAVGPGPAIVAACEEILTCEDSEDWKSFVQAVTVSLHRCIDGHNKFSLPSDLKAQFLIGSAHYARDEDARSSLKSKLSSVIGDHVAVFDLLLSCLIRLYSTKLLSFTLHHINNQVPKLSDTYTVTKQKTDTLDFKQNMHYIGGANLKSMLGKGLVIKKENRTEEHIRYLGVLKSQFLIGEFCCAPDKELMAWTLSQDRGGLKKINAKALDLFVALGIIVKDLEHFDGSLYLNEVFEKVTTSPDILLKWDDIIRDLLPKKESWSLLYGLCYYFSNTWRSGIVSRRKDELSTRKDAPKHGTSGVSFRAKLST
ncbi:uncharacterized protein LOC113209924 [Frankliniella occidentalis]|uniref:Uncharacterized protein LOC113209924 n=1 Tax=Frankliniella occidentalis TaxID=133901 RepID=A0A6J1SQC9_FRAOC|nr:uncharacterized protein LOC113209924 [Frankliniella occidentalis]